MYRIGKRTEYIAKVAVLAALAFIIMIFEFAIPFAPPFLKLDFSDIPALLATFALGPVAGIAVELVKNLLHALTLSSTAGIGELSNFLLGTAYIVPAGLLYKRFKNKKGAVVSLAAGGISMTIAASVLNYFVFIPLYGTVLNFPVDKIVGWSMSVNKYIVDLRTLIAFGIVPFNIFKSAVVSIILIILYKRLSPILHYRKH